MTEKMTDFSDDTTKEDWDEYREHLERSGSRPFTLPDKMAEEMKEALELKGVHPVIAQLLSPWWRGK